MWNAYENNVKLVIPYAIELVNFFKKNGKKVVITADHGNVIKRIGGNIVIAGHPCNLYLKDLVKVPWIEF